MSEDSDAIVDGPTFNDDEDTSSDHSLESYTEIEQNIISEPYYGNISRSSIMFK